MIKDFRSELVAIAKTVAASKDGNKVATDNRKYVSRIALMVNLNGFIQDRQWLKEQSAKDMPLKPLSDAITAGRKTAEFFDSGKAITIESVTYDKSYFNGFSVYTLPDVTVSTLYTLIKKINKNESDILDSEKYVTEQAIIALETEHNTPLATLKNLFSVEEFNQLLEAAKDEIRSKLETDTKTQSALETVADAIKQALASGITQEQLLELIAPLAVSEVIAA